MSVIKKEMTDPRVTRSDILGLSFIDKSPYTGSKRKLRYRLEKNEGHLLVSSWHTPFSYDMTPAGDISRAEFEFSEEGLNQAVGYLDKLLEEQG